MAVIGFVVGTVESEDVILLWRRWLTYRYTATVRRCVSYYVACARWRKHKPVARVRQPYYVNYSIPSKKRPVAEIAETACWKKSLLAVCVEVLPTKGRCLSEIANHEDKLGSPPAIKSRPP